MSDQKMLQGVRVDKPLPISKRTYKPPVLIEYGNLAELTLTNANVRPGDGFGGSFAV